MKKSTALFIASLLLLSACGSPFSDSEETSRPQVDSQPETQEETQAEAEAIALKTKETACENSGGKFSDETCTCPTDTYGSKNTPIFTYDEKTGYCVDPDGEPGGILASDGKGADLWVESEQ